MHHALLEGAGFGELGFQFGDFGIHVGEDGGDGGLFGIIVRDRKFLLGDIRF